MNETFLVEMNPQFAADYCSKAREALSSISTNISNCATYSVLIRSVTTSVTTHLNCFRLLVTHGFHIFFTRPCHNGLIPLMRPLKSSSVGTTMQSEEFLKSGELFHLAFSFSLKVLNVLWKIRFVTAKSTSPMRKSEP
jgi:hypothetical protein